MSELIKFKVEHSVPLLGQPSNVNVRGLFLGPWGKSLESTDAFTGFVNNRVAVCGGVGKVWEGRGHIWTLFNEDFKDNFVPVFRLMRKFIKEQLQNYRRLEASIPTSMGFAMRRAERLGFKLECLCARNYLPDGTDCAIYAIFKGDI